MNQILFLPPNVAGWPGGKYWIDSSTLLFRLKLPSLMVNQGEIDWDEKEDMPENMVSTKKTRRNKQLQTTSSIDKVVKELSKKDRNEVVEFLVQPALPDSVKQKLLESNSLVTKELIIKILSLPEYQLC